MLLPSLSEGFDTGSKTAARLNIAVFAAGIATFVNMYCTQSILPQIAHTFGVAPALTGLTVTAPLLATAIMAPVIGAISDRFGRRKLILGAAILLTIPTTLAAYAGSFDMLVLWRFIQGLILPFIFTVTIAYIGDETEGAATARLSGIYMSGAVFGGFAGRFMAGLVTQGAGWRPALLVVAGITLAMAVLIGFLLRPEQKFRPVYGISRALHSFPVHLSNQPLMAIYGVGFGVLFTLVAVFTFVNFRLAGAPYFMGPAALGTVFVVYLGGVVISPLSARLANRFGRVQVMLAVAVVIALGLGLTLAAALPLIICGLLLISSAVFVQQTLGTAFIGIAARSAKSTAAGLYATFYYIGGSAGGIIPGPLFHHFGWPGCVAIVAAMQAATLFLVLRFWRPVTGS